MTTENKFKCKLPAFKLERVLSMQDAQQKVGWGITAFDLPKAWNVTKGEGVKVAVLDSTPSWSPLLCKTEDGSLRILTISELFEQTLSKIYLTDKGEEVKKVNDFHVWNGHSKHGNHWQSIKHVLRHKYNGKIHRINTHGGVVDVTPNHSLIARNGAVIDAKEVNKGTSLSISRLTKFSHQGSFFLGGEDWAWLAGFWAAEGSVYCRGDGYIVTFSQKDIEPLIKVQSILNRSAGIYSRIDKDSDEMHKLIISSKDFYNYVTNNWITNDGEKRVPDSILNAPNECRLAFLEGYNLGDGHHKKSRLNWEHRIWTTKSQILACGLLILIKLVLNQKFVVHTREDKPNIVAIGLNKPNSTIKTIDPSIVKRIMEIDYDGYVYDIETEQHTFGCGVGLIRLHNTGCDLDHPDLEGNLLQGVNLVKKGKEPQDDSTGHGTHCAGIIAAKNNDIGMVGVAPAAKIVPVKVLDRNGNGNLITVAEGVRWAVDYARVDIMCMSLGSPGPVQQVRKAIQYAASKGIPCFVAAGNAGLTKQLFYPANYPETISIGSINENFDRSKFSNTGSNLDFMAPGNHIFSTVPDNWYAVMSGTSMAAPFAVGVAALLLSYVRNNSNAKIQLKTVDDYRNALRMHTRPISNKEWQNKEFYQGLGIIDPLKLIEGLV